MSSAERRARRQRLEAELREPIAGTREPDAQTPESTLDSYKRAFPEQDVEALATHLALAAASSFLARGVEQRIQEYGFDLSRPRYSIVRMLYLSPEQAIAQGEIAQALGVSGSNVTQLIDALVSDGWVERISSSSDKRVTHAALTQAGKDRASRLVPAIVDYMVESCSALTADEHGELRRLITKVRERA